MRLFSIFMQSLKKLNPIGLIRNPVIFLTEITVIVTLLEWWFVPVQSPSFYFLIAFWLFLTVLFANFSESIAEARNRAQAASLRKTRVETTACRKGPGGHFHEVKASDLRKGDIVKVSAGDIIPGDGEILEGMASIDESAITGESAPVIRAAGTDRSSVTAGTKVLSDHLMIRIASDPGHSFLDRMIDLIENTIRRKSANEIALTILFAGLTFTFLVVVICMEIFGRYFHLQFSVTLLVALLVCLIPTTIAGLFSAIGIAGISRLMKKNVLAMNGQAVEAAGDVDLILIDKTGTITLGHRHATEIKLASGVEIGEFVRAAYFSSVQDCTGEGRSIVQFLQKHQHQDIPEIPPDLTFIAFTAQTRMSGVDLGDERIRKGAVDAVQKFTGQAIPHDLQEAIQGYCEQGGTPLAVCDNRRILGVILLKDVLKKGLSTLFARFRAMGIRTIMMTGDNPVTAQAIAQEAGVDSFFAEISPEQKLAKVVEMQKKGWMVAMTGDGTNDAPALAQADVGVAMHTGTQAAKEAGNMIDLDSHPEKLFEIVEIGKQMLTTRGALTTFSIANDVAKYFAIIPAILLPFFPSIQVLNLMRLSTPQNAVLSAVIFNALIIPALIPLAFKGVKILTKDALTILSRNLLIYGLGGVLVPFLGIKVIDMILVAIGVVL
jgi:potassium-transporting ATPase ATP-binding subunit